VGGEGQTLTPSGGKITLNANDSARSRPTSIPGGEREWAFSLPSTRFAQFGTTAWPRVHLQDKQEENRTSDRRGARILKGHEIAHFGAQMRDFKFPASAPYTLSVSAKPTGKANINVTSRSTCRSSPHISQFLPPLDHISDASPSGFWRSQDKCGLSPDVSASGRGTAIVNILHARCRVECETSGLATRRLRPILSLE